MPSHHRAVVLAFSTLFAMRAGTCASQDLTSPPPEPTVTRYPSSFFADSRTYTAFDMLELVPGYTFADSDTDVRGLASASGNVLIDGSRPASKYESLEAILRRIPADCVERIELISAGTPGLDMQGHTNLVNVVRGGCARTRGSVEIGDAFYERSFDAPRLAIEAAHRSDDRLIELSTELYRSVDDEHGAGRRPRVSAQGEVLRDGRFSQDEGEKTAAFAGGYESTTFGGKLRASAALERSRFGADILDQALVPEEDTVSGAEFETKTSSELGLQFERALGTTTQLELSAIDRSLRSRGGERELHESESSLFLEDSDSRETVVRTLLRHVAGRLAIEGGLEAALNRLDSSARLTENDTAVPIPNAAGHVEEQRGEASIAATIAPGAHWNVELGSRFEYSQLTYRGHDALTKTFFFPKPRAIVTWTHAADRVQWRIERRVGQLDFDDFVSSASLSAGTVTAGNPDLEPDRAWRTEISWQRQIFATGAFTLALRHEKIDDLVDRVPVIADEVFDAIGNIGSGTRDELEVTATLPLTALGIPGAVLKPAALWRRSRARDPVTGATRPISEDAPREASMHFVQSLPSWKARWGTDLTLASEEREYRFDEVRTDRLGTLCNVFIEYQPTPAWNVRVFANNLTDRAAERRREVYEGARGSAPLRYVETRTLSIGPYAGFQVQRSFGK